MQLPADALKNLKPVIDALANYIALVAIVCFWHSLLFFIMKVVSTSLIATSPL